MSVIFYLIVNLLYNCMDEDEYDINWSFSMHRKWEQTIIRQMIHATHGTENQATCIQKYPYTS